MYVFMIHQVPVVLSLNSAEVTIESLLNQADVVTLVRECCWQFSFPHFVEFHTPGPLDQFALVF